MIDLAAGLQQLHGIGIIHRDLKPSNVLLHEGRWKLADFGIARDEEIGTQSATFIGWGSPPYMAPEIWEGRSPTVKSDLYAMGCVGFELVKGAPPYVGDDRRAIETGHRTHEIPIIPCGNALLRNLITRLIAKDPGRRTQDARAALERLHATLAPRVEVLDSIVDGLTEHAAEKSQEVARKAAEEARREEEMARIDAGHQLAIQALEDLREIVRDALEGLRIIEPNVRSGEANEDDEEAPGNARDIFRRMLPPHIENFIFIATDDAVLRIHFWMSDEAEMVAAGCVGVTNRRRPHNQRLYGRDGSMRYKNYEYISNLAYRNVGDRLIWQACRFASSDAKPGGDVLTYPDLKRASEVRVSEDSVGQFTPETLLWMYRKAVDLKAPPSAIDAALEEWRKS